MKFNLFLQLILLLLIPSLSFSQINRTLNGAGNNISNSDWGRKGTVQIRITSNAFADSMNAPSGMNRMNARMISNSLMDQPNASPSYLGLSDYWWTFGQFIDHDITLVSDDTSEFFPVMIPIGDPIFDSASTGTQMIPMFRSAHDPLTGTSASNPRLAVNTITTWLDASAVYGSDFVRAQWLRTFVDGKLKMSAGNFLPFNTITGELNDPIDLTAPVMANENPNATKFFVGGDIRVNEQPTLTCLHTLFAREHNRLCDSLSTANPGWNDETIYQKARKLVGAYIQNITYYEWMPAAGLIPSVQTGYNSAVQPAISNVFSASAYRLGHTMVNESLIRIDQFGDTISFGQVALKDGFFNPEKIYNEGGITPYLQGMATQMQQNYDLQISNSLRNFLFSSPGFFPGLDLAAININRGRDRGLADFNQMRVDVGLPALTLFTEINSDTSIANQLSAIYNGDINDIDAWMGMLAEEHTGNSAFGDLVNYLISEQFERLRDADRFYFEWDAALSQQEITEIRNTKFSDIIKRNSDVFVIQDSVFFAQPYNSLTSIEATAQGTTLTVYPNPFDRELNVSLQGINSDQLFFELIDLSGRIVFAKRIDESEVVEISNELSPGFYVYRIETLDRSKKFTGKLIKH